MQVTWLLQGSFLFESGGYRLLIDPYISDYVERMHGVTRLASPPLTAAELRPSAVYCTHDHIDHLDPEGLPEILARHPGVRVAGPVSIQRKFAELGWDPSCVDVLGIGAQHALGPFTLTVVKAFHSDPEATGLLIAAEGVLIYLSGDTLFTDELPALVRAAAGGQTLDHLFICINGRFGNMNCDQGLTMVRELHPTTAAPMHYGLFAENTADPAPFLAGCRELGIASFAMTPGQEFPV
jgi:L-ascorbate metabolism protein UlaG (beta-lactamase superfamily)